MSEATSGANGPRGIFLENVVAHRQLLPVISRPLYPSHSPAYPTDPRNFGVESPSTQSAPCVGVRANPLPSIMKKTSLSWLSLSLLLLGQVPCALTPSRAGTYDSPVTLGKDSNVSESGFGRQRFSLNFDTRFGYDDNTLGQPDNFATSVTNPVTGKRTIVSRDVDTSDSAFFNFSLGVGYTAATPRLSLTAGADIGVSYYFDRPGRSYDVNGGLSLRLTYKLTPRAFLELSTYNAYESQGDYGASNLTNFNGQFGGAGRAAGTTANLNGDYFYTTNRGALTYQFTPRISTVFSDTIIAFAYADDPYSKVQDRIENYVSLEGQYLLLPNFSLALNYRYGYIGYFGVNNDSQTHFVLTGFDYSANQRLKASIRVGVEFREYFDTVGDETSPYAEGNVTYSLSRNSSIAFSGRYGIEEGNLATDNTSTDTLRLGLDYTQSITARISAYLGLYYTHSFYNTPTTKNAGAFNENTYDVSVGARYAINRHLSAEIGYTHTTEDSDVEARSYDRNRYFAGVRLSF